MTTMVHKVTLGSGKVVLLRDIKIKHYELAMKAAGHKAGKNELLAGFSSSCELLKMLIVQIDGKDVSKSGVEDLDALFSASEFRQLSKFLDKLQQAEGEDEDPKSEVVSFGKE